MTVLWHHAAPVSDARLLGAARNRSFEARELRATARAMDDEARSLRQRLVLANSVDPEGDRHDR